MHDNFKENIDYETKRQYNYIIYAKFGSNMLKNDP